MTNNHENHRERMKKRFLENGLDSFAPHEVLEFILYYSIPRKDTNQIAHKMIEHFGSVSSTIDANIIDLKRIGGVGTHCAILLKLLKDIGQYYHLDKHFYSEKFESLEQIAEYCIYKHIADMDENISVMMLDSKMRLLGTEYLAIGAECKVNMDLEKLGKFLFRYEAKSFIIVHSHPSGDLAPSDSDIAITQKIYSATACFDKLLMEHIIVSGNKYLPIMQLLRRQGYDFYEY